jgi:hypothetical protein
MEKNQRWRELCAQAALEKDPDRLMQLVAEISRLFDEEHARSHPRTRKVDDVLSEDSGLQPEPNEQS